MSKKALNEKVNEYCKYVNDNKQEFGIEEDVLVSTKLSVDEIEKQCESIGEMVSDNLGNDVPDEFVTLYTELGELIEKVKKTPAANKKDAGKTPTDPKKESNTDDQTEDDQGVNDSGEPEKTQKKKAPKKTGGKKQKAAASGAASEDKDKAIKKLYDLLPAEAIDNLDSATMRTILQSFK